jgi:hypothetical protein
MSRETSEWDEIGYLNRLRELGGEEERRQRPPVRCYLLSRMLMELR